MEFDHISNFENYLNVGESKDDDGRTLIMRIPVKARLIFKKRFTVADKRIDLMLQIFTKSLLLDIDEFILKNKGVECVSYSSTELNNSNEYVFEFSVFIHGRLALVFNSKYNEFKKKKPSTIEYTEQDIKDLDTFYSSCSVLRQKALEVSYNFISEDYYDTEVLLRSILV